MSKQMINENDISFCKNIEQICHLSEANMNEPKVGYFEQEKAE
jgi:hypothetical protein